MLDSVKEFKETFLGDAYRDLVRKVFKANLNRDKNNKLKYKGYPSKEAKKFTEWARSTGVKFTDAEKSDFTLAPLLKQYSYYLGGESSVFYKAATHLNMKFFGGFLNSTRFTYQINFFESYREYAKSFQNITIIENIMDKEIPLYLLKILNDFHYNADRSGMNLKSFVLRNRDYFKEVAIYFDFQDKPELQCLDDAIEELGARREAIKRDYLLRGSIASASFDMIIMILLFGKKLIPDVLTNFEASITDFSGPVRAVNSISVFLTNKWYLAILVLIGVFALFKTSTMKLIMGYLAFKIPGISDYVINDQLLRFLKSYMNLITFDTVRNSYVQSLKMVDNAYLRFILENYVNENGRDIGDTGITFYRVLEDIPYIPREYVDMIKESEIMGKPEEGIQKTIDLIEPRIAVLVKKVNKQLITFVLIFSALLSLWLFSTLYKDVNIIINAHNQEFIDNLRN